jgi:putative hydrolase of the HAD superfamily
LFDEVLFSYEEGLVKPDKQIYLNALERMKVSPENALFVGDGGSQELMGAKSLGIGTVQTNHFMKNAEFKHTGVEAYADYTIMDMEELLDVIKEVTNE